MGIFGKNTRAGGKRRKPRTFAQGGWAKPAEAEKHAEKAARKAQFAKNKRTRSALATLRNRDRA